jgi:phosphoglycerate dehydrogenase-like enzyme
MFAKAVLIDFKEGDIPSAYFNRIKKLFRAVKLLDRDNSRLQNELKDTDVVFAKIFSKIDREIFDAAPKLKYVGVLSTAFDAIDVKCAKSKGVIVCNLGGYSTEAVAEFAVATLFEQVRELEKAKNQARKKDFSFTNFMGRDLKGRTLGVIGAGKIGSRIAGLALGIGMKVTYFSREKKPDIEKMGARKKSLDYILSSNEFVILALALNKETGGIINKTKIKTLKKGSIFISIAPPKLIDSGAMLARANKGEITFIFDHSDDIDLPLAKKFLESKNCTVYPPIAFRTEEANTNRFEIFTSNIEKFAKGKGQNRVI